MASSSGEEVSGGLDFLMSRKLAECRRLEGAAPRLRRLLVAAVRGRLEERTEDHQPRPFTGTTLTAERRSKAPTVVSHRGAGRSGGTPRRRPGWSPTWSCSWRGGSGASSPHLSRSVGRLLLNLLCPRARGRRHRVSGAAPLTDSLRAFLDSGSNPAPVVTSQVHIAVPLEAALPAPWNRGTGCTLGERVKDRGQNGRHEAGSNVVLKRGPVPPLTLVLVLGAREASLAHVDSGHDNHANFQGEARHEITSAPAVWSLS
jgi:hypothetical protein